MRVYVISAFFLLLISLGKSQGFRSRFCLPQAYGNTSRALFEASPGKYFAAGITYDTLKGYYTNRLTIMGLDQGGKLQWTKKYGNAKFQYLYNGFIRRSFYKQGNFVYHACCVRDDKGSQFGVLIKFALNGDTIWQRIYRDPQEDVIPQMVTGSVDGGFFITGFFQNWTTHTSPGLLIKTDANGKELWRKRLDKIVPNTSDGKAILQDSATKKIVIVGYQYRFDSQHFDNILVVDSLGNVLKRWNYSWLSGVAYDLIQTKDKKFVVVGFEYENLPQFGGLSMRSMVAKFDLGNIQNPLWRIVYDKLTPGGNAFCCLRELDSGEILIAGSIDTMQMVEQPRNMLVRMTKMDGNGNVTFNRYYDYKTISPEKDNLMSIASLELASDGAWLAAIEVSNRPDHYFFVKYDGNGCDSSAAHCATLNLVGLQQLKNENEELNIFPNPSSDFLNVIAENPANDMELTITDVSGRIVDKVMIEPKQKIDIRALSKGIYFIEIRIKEKVIYTGKVVKQD